MQTCSGILGWLHNVRGIPVEELSLSTAIPSAERGGVAVAFDYIQWLTEERSLSVSTEGLVIRSIMSAAKFLYHSQSTVGPSPGQARATMGRGRWSAAEYHYHRTMGQNSTRRGRIHALHLNTICTAVLCAPSQSTFFVSSIPFFPATGSPGVPSAMPFVLPVLPRILPSASAVTLYICQV